MPIKTLRRRELLPELDEFQFVVSNRITKVYNLIFKYISKFKEKIKQLLLYLQYSETSFLLFFSIVVGLCSGFGAIIFRWLINNFKMLFFEQGHNVFQFLGPYYVIFIPAIGGLIVGPLIYFFATMKTFSNLWSDSPDKLSIVMEKSVLLISLK